MKAHNWKYHDCDVDYEERTMPNGTVVDIEIGRVTWECGNEDCGFMIGQPDYIAQDDCEGGEEYEYDPDSD